MADARLSQRAQAQLGLPEGYKTFSPFPFKGMNVQSTPISVEDTEFVYLENFVRIGDGNLRTVADAGTSIYTALGGKTVIYYSFYTIGTTYYCAIFLSDGTAYQLNLATTALTQMGTTTGFYLASNPSAIPCCKQWGTQYLLISNNNTVNDYWAWDGSLLYGAGTVAPSGVNILSGGYGYSSAPSYSIAGGSGSGVGLTPIIQGGSITQLQITNPGTGYQPGDKVTVVFAGGGSDATPYFVPVLAPVGVAGATVSSPGSGYTSASVSITGGGGSGATATAVIQNGQIINITITNAGSNYTATPTITITGTGTGASAVAVLFPTRVVSATQITPGSGYWTPPLVTFSGGGGSGATGVALLGGGGVARVDVSAAGSGYTTAPTVTFVSAVGSGATATATLDGTSVSKIIVTAAGSGYTGPVQVVISGGGGSGAAGIVYLTPSGVASITISSSGQYYTSTPTITFSAGQNNAAVATINLMPFGVSGSALETYLSRVWLVNPATGPYATVPATGNWTASAPGSLIDFATSDGAVNGLNTDAFLQTKYTNIHQSSGYLYFTGDGSVSVISNVSTSGVPATTTFNYQNVDPQSGALFRDSVQDFGRSAIMANNTGIYGLYGGSLAKISGKLDQLFQNAIFPPTNGAILPTSAIATIYNVKHYLLLMTVRDPDTLQFRNVMVTWNEKDWVITSQTVALTTITTQKFGSLYTAFGCDGTKIYPLFQTPSLTLAKRFDTKHYGVDRPYVIKEALRYYLQAQDQSSTNSGVTGTVSVVTTGVEPTAPYNPTMQNESFLSATFQQPNFKGEYPFWSLFGSTLEGVAFVDIQLRFTSTSPDFVLGNAVIGYRDHIALF